MKKKLSLKERVSIIEHSIESQRSAYGRRIKALEDPAKYSKLDIVRLKIYRGRWTVMYSEYWSGEWRYHLYNKKTGEEKTLHLNSIKRN